MNIYLPTDYIDKPCHEIHDNFIRVYENNILNENTIYTDIFINQDYMIKQNETIFTNEIKCDLKSTFTDEIYYRTDFDSILIILLIMSIFCFYIPIKVFLRLFRRFL